MMAPPLSDTRPPTLRLATFAVPTFPVACEPAMRPWFEPTRPPRLVVCSWLVPMAVRPAAPVTAPLAKALEIMPSFQPTRPPPVAPEPTLTAPVAQVCQAPQGGTAV